MQRLPYDHTDPLSIDGYAKGLMSKTLREATSVTDADLNSGKGDLGTLVERFYYSWTPPSSEHKPDFPDAGLELKTTGVKRLMNGKLVPKERLVLSMINYHHVVKETFGESYLLAKVRLMLILFYYYNPGLSVIDMRFLAKKLWSLPDADFKIINDDWDKIVNKVRAGKAHELSEGDTLYLGACTKSATSKNRTTQPFSDEPAKPRAFSFKPSYIRLILGEKSVDKELYENFLKEAPIKPFEQLVLDKLNKFKGTPAEELFSQYGRGINQKSKDKFAKLTNRLLGIKSKKVSEFEKAGIRVKTLRLKPSGIPKEDMSFPTFKYLDIIEQQWDDSDFKEVVEGKFLFVVFQENAEGNLIFRKAMFWNMPYPDRLQAQAVWEETVAQIRAHKPDKLPGKKFNEVAHVRPHGRNKKDTYPAPGGENLTKKCFWLNARYLANQLKLA